MVARVTKPINRAELLHTIDTFARTGRVEVEARAHPPGRGQGRAGHARTRGRVRASPLPGVQRFGPSSTGTPIASTRCRDACAISATAASNASWLRALGSRKPLSLRTYWRAAASSSPVVAVDDNVTRLHAVRQLLDRLLGRTPRRHHDPYRARRFQLSYQIVE